MGIGSILKLALPVAAAVAAPYALGAVAASGTAAAATAANVMGPVTFGQATAAGLGFAGNSTIASVAGAFSGGSSLGNIFSSVNSIGNVIGGITNIAGAAARPLATYQQAQALEYQATQASMDWLAQADNLEYQSGVSTINGKIQEANRIHEEQSRYATEQIMMRENRQLRGAAVASYSTAGVTMSGSTKDVMAYMAQEGALGVALMRFESFHRESGYEYARDASYAEAAQYDKAAETARINAKSALEQGLRSSSYAEMQSYVEGLSAIPDVIDGVSDLLKTLGG